VVLDGKLIVESDNASEFRLPVMDDVFAWKCAKCELLGVGMVTSPKFILPGEVYANGVGLGCGSVGGEGMVTFSLSVL
jgi:hypothetical protein